MGMDTQAAQLALVTGAIGFILGLLLWSLIRRLFQLEQEHPIFQALTVTIAIGISLVFLSNIVERHVGPYFGITSLDEYYVRLEADPVMQRIAEDFPSKVSDFRLRLLKAQREGGYQATEREYLKINQEIDAVYGPYYIARARNADLFVFFDAYVKTLAALSKDTPELCYPWLFGIGDDDLATAALLNDTVFDDYKWQKGILVVNAYDRVPIYDRITGKANVERIMVSIAIRHGDTGIALLGGERPPLNKDEERQVCDLYYLLYASILTLERDEAEAALRSLFEPVADVS